MNSNRAFEEIYQDCSEITLYIISKLETVNHYLTSVKNQLDYNDSLKYSYDVPHLDNVLEHCATRLDKIPSRLKQCEEYLEELKISLELIGNELQSESKKYHIINRKYDFLKSFNIEMQSRLNYIMNYIHSE